MLDLTAAADALPATPLSEVMEAEAERRERKLHLDARVRESEELGLYEEQ